MIWVEVDKKYYISEIGKQGKWNLFEVFFDGARSTGTPPYRLKCCLPGIKDDCGHFPSPDEAKQKAEKVLSLWLEGARLIEAKE